MSTDRLGAAFWRYCAAAGLANLGDGIRAAAFPLLAASLTDDPLAVAAVGAAQTAPWLVTGLAAGMLADRRPPRTLLAVADAVRVLTLAVLLLTVVTGVATVGWLLGCALVLAVGEAVRDTAAQVAIPALVPDRLLERANGRLVAAEVVGNEFVGPPAGAALFAVGVALPFAANGAALTLAVLLVLTLPLAAVSRVAADAPAHAVGPGLRAGLTWLWRHRPLRALAAAVALVALADSGWFAVLVLYTRQVLELGPTGFGALLTAGGVGGVLGALVAARLVARLGVGSAAGLALAGSTVPPLLLAVVTDVVAALAVVVVTGASFAVLNVAAASFRQRVVPAGVLGRVTGAWRTLTLGSSALGAVAGGAVAGVVGFRAPFAVCALVGAGATLLWMLGRGPGGAAARAA
jgi:MFS family permease